ncbi:hypothetical protein Micbo1qcDRAFT_162650 [Microdochium bolleyi]|uniref:Secreted protein n=1 Tax=Microdochium bolleyi TaxID=196109 RepID=A0A136J5A6_9PEZI|nr:hypothetical protein Micbo1qcDRAFT_162650 [Microdochium bolleyi]
MKPLERCFHEALLLELLSVLATLYPFCTVALQDSEPVQAAGCAGQELRQHDLPKQTNLANGGPEGGGSTERP